MEELDLVFTHNAGLDRGFDDGKQRAAQVRHGGQPDSFLLLSDDPSPWRGEHFFAVSNEVPGVEMTRLSGKYLTGAFEGPFKDTPKWMRQLQEHVAAKGRAAKKPYLFYTTCPKCIKPYGKNYVIGFAEVA